MIIVLVGYMASGKTSIGKILAKKLSYKFIDLDDYIEEKEHLTVKAIFKKKGEIYFRKQESFYLEELIKNQSDIILSLGGGTPCYNDNMDVILASNTVKSVYLRGTPATLSKKLIRKKAKRPLIAHIETEEAMVEFVAKHLFERMPFYDLAKLKVSIDHKTKDEIANNIMEAILK